MIQRNAVFEELRCSASILLSIFFCFFLALLVAYLFNLFFTTPRVVQEATTWY